MSLVSISVLLSTDLSVYISSYFLIKFYVAYYRLYALNNFYSVSHKKIPFA